MRRGVSSKCGQAYQSKKYTLATSTYLIDPSDHQTKTLYQILFNPVPVLKLGTCIFPGRFHPVPGIRHVPSQRIRVTLTLGYTLPLDS